MFICTLAALKKSSKKKETETEKHIAEVFNMLVTGEGRLVKSRDDKILDFDLVFIGCINTKPGFWLLLFIGCFQKGNFPN